MNKRKQFIIETELQYEEAMSILNAFKPNSRDYIQFLELKEAVENYELSLILKKKEQDEVL